MRKRVFKACNQKHSIYINIIAFVLTITVVFPGFAADHEQSIAIDLGPVSNRTFGGWNNLIIPSMMDYSIDNLRDNSYRRTVVRLTQVDDFSGLNSQGKKTGSEYPSTAVSDSFYIARNHRSRARMKFENLIPGAYYTLFCYGSRLSKSQGQDPGRKTTIEIRGRSKEYDASDKNSNYVVFENIVANEKGEITFSVNISEGSKYGYLSLIEIRGSFYLQKDIIKPRIMNTGQPQITAASYYSINGYTGRPVMQHRENISRHISSMTKMMTARLVFKEIEKDPDLLKRDIRIPDTAVHRTGGSSAWLVADGTIEFSELLFGMLLPSGNDAAVTAAIFIGGRYLEREGHSEFTEKQALESFVKQMNIEAENLGMNNSRFFNPHGIEKNYSSARDLGILVFENMKNPLFRAYVNTRNHNGVMYREGNKKRTVHWRNTNKALLKHGVIGVKTGSGDSAGSCLISAERYGSGFIITVMMGATSNSARYTDTANLNRYILHHHYNKTTQ